MSRFGRGRGAWDETNRVTRVTDRRRLHPDDEGESAAPAADVPNLKPSYVEELEARTRAAEQKVRKCRRVLNSCAATSERDDEDAPALNKAADERAHREKANSLPRCCGVGQSATRDEATESGASAADVAEVFVVRRQF